MLPLVFHPDVRSDLDEAYRWYENQSSGLGDEFLAAVEEVFKRIVQTPEIHAPIYRDVRRSTAKRFPYGIFYRTRTDRVEIIAIYHGRRDPSGWRNRV